MAIISDLLKFLVVGSNGEESKSEISWDVSVRKDSNVWLPELGGLNLDLGLNGLISLPSLSPNMYSSLNALLYLSMLSWNVVGLE